MKKMLMSVMALVCAGLWGDALTWTGAGGDKRWNNPANWSSRDGAVQVPGNWCSVTIENTGTEELVLENDVEGTPMIGTLTVNGGPVKITGLGLRCANPACVTANADLTLTTPIELANQSSYAFSVAPNKTCIVDAVISGVGTLVRKEAGYLDLKRANTYAGGTVLSNGVTRIYTPTSLGVSVAPVRLASNGTTTYGKLGIAAAGTYAYPIYVENNTASHNTKNEANVYAMVGGVTLTGAITGQRLGLRVTGGALTVDATIDLDPENGLLLLHPAGQTINFRQRVAAASMDVGNATDNGENGTINWYSPENRFTYFHSEYKNQIAHCSDAWGTNAICSFGYCEGGRSYYNLNNFDQTIDRLDYSRSSACATTEDWRHLQGHEVYGGQSAGARLTMRATADTICDAYYDEKLTLVWWPQGDYTYRTFDNDGKGFGRTPQMSGGIVVSNGTFIVNGTNSFPRATFLEVADGATFRWDSSVGGVGYGLGFVTNLTLGVGATFEVTEGVPYPLSSFCRSLRLTPSSHLSLAAGVEFAPLMLDLQGGDLTPYRGKWVTGAEGVSGAVKVDWLVGAGKLYVPMSASGQSKGVWSAGATPDDRVSVSANWQSIPDWNLASEVTFKNGTHARLDRSLVADTLAFSGDGFTIDGSETLKLGSGGISIESPSGAVAKPEIRLEAPIFLDGNPMWTVPDASQSLVVSGPVSSVVNGYVVQKEGAGLLNLCATGSTVNATWDVKEGALQVAGDNAFGGTGSRLLAAKGVVATFAGGDYAGGLEGTFYSKNSLVFAAGTTNVFRGNVKLIGGTRLTVGANALVEVHGTADVGGWSYVTGAGKDSSVLRFWNRFTISSGQHDGCTYDFRAPNNSFGNEHCLKYGSIRVLLNCENAWNTSKTPVWVWNANNIIDICGHTNRIGSLELRNRTNYITNSGEKATLWVTQTTEVRQEDNGGSKYPCVQAGDFCGPTTLGKLGASTLTFTNRMVSSTGDLLVNEGKVAFCPESGWPNGTNIVVSGATASVEIRRKDAFGKFADVSVSEGGRLVLGGTDDAAFTQRVNSFTIDGVKQKSGIYTSANCSSIMGPGALAIVGSGTVFVLR